MTFSDFNLHPSLLRGIEQLGFAQPTPIQTQAIPPALEGRDVLASAMTGSGKTAAFLLPIMHQLLAQPRGTTRALILTPTRELAVQIDGHLAQLGRHTSLRGATVIGGVSSIPQMRAFKSGVEVLIATPGRLLDHCEQPYARLTGLEILVLDEADRMLEMGFLPDIRRILTHLSARRQTLFFSATMPGPIASLAKEILRNPLTINQERRAAPAVGVTQNVYAVAQNLKAKLLLELMKQKSMRQVIVFTRTKHRANRLADFLSAARVGCERIHGNRSQAQRTQALEGFKSGKYQVLVATDIAARGIDIEALDYVVNFDVPLAPEDYIHRVGRTARAERTGDALTFVAPDEEDKLRAIERTISKRLPRLILPDFDYSKAAAEPLEVPMHERIAAIRTAKAEAQARRVLKAQRGTQQDSQAQTQVRRKPQAGTARDDSMPARPATGKGSRTQQHASSKSGVPGTVVHTDSRRGKHGAGQTRRERNS
ncbi:MAG: DEAD/DEAH box helicase [Gemmatimonadaceae bacterium]|nr:DEAD/DEAH box helicase [Gloeobacterales cyanobacterium ES-bin-141]